MERIKREMTVLRGSFRFQENDGSLVSVSSGNHELSLSGAPFFSLGLRSQTGELVTLSSADFHFSCTEENDALLFRHSGHPGFPELCVRTAIREQDGMLHFRPDVRNVPFEYLLEWIDLPQPVLPEGGTIFWPQLEGVLIDDPRARQNSPWSRYHVLGFLGRTEGIAYSEGGYYPGVCQMQFLSWEKDGYVLYFGAHDLKHGTKAVEYEPLENLNRTDETQRVVENTAENTDANTTNQENTISAMDSSSYQPDRKNELSSNTTSKSTNTGKDTYISKSHGTIGVITNQDMIEKQRRVVRYDFYADVAALYEKDLCVSLY